MTDHTPRQVATAIIQRWTREQGFLENYLHQVQDHRALVMEIVYGVVKQRRALEWLIGRCTRRRPDPLAQAWLMSGAYQLFFMEPGAEHAVVNEAVAGARRELSVPVGGMINAVLRRMTRERDELLRDLSRQSLAVRSSHPDVLVERWARVRGERDAARLCEWNNGRPQVVMRLELSRIGMEAMLHRLRQSGYEAEPHPFRPEECITLPRGARVSELPGYDEGWFSIQDPSTLVSVDLLDPQPGDHVFDACAAPGGKSGAIAARLGDRGRLTAVDRDSTRVERLCGNMARLGRPDVDCAVYDVLQQRGHDPIAAETYDRVLLDVPCSNTGVLRRRPDARWKFSVARLRRLNGLQMRLLQAVSTLVKPGGILVYSTCSLELEENEALVGRWLADTPGYRLDKQTTCLPHSALIDGAYAARIVRAE